MRAVVFVVITLAVLGAPVTSLPGYSGELPSMDAGYITVNEDSGKELFYMFVESQSGHADQDPLVLWFTGGPGCSGLDAFVNENGPFKFDAKTGELTDRYYSWSKVANVLWLEQPAGVGFSNSDTGNYRTNDTQAAADNYVFLKNFLKAFPQLQGRDVWLTGESYAGMYIPTLAYNILSGDDEQLSASFQGFMLGNPVIFCNSFGLDTENYYILQFNRYFYAGLLSYTTFQKWYDLGCDQKVTLRCRAFFMKAQTEMGIVTQQLKSQVELEEAFTVHPDLDTDNRFQSFCTGNGTLDRALSSNSDDCNPLGTVTIDYFNRQDVQEAIHAKVGTKWSVCANIAYSSNLANKGMIPFLKNILKLDSGINILYYSGDVDIATVPTMVTQACLAELADTVTLTKSWGPWRVNGWHAGYVETFDKYTFATVKGAGHEVPQYQPHIAFEMFSRFLSNQNLKEAQPAATPVRDVMTQGAVFRQRFFSDTD